MTSTQDGLNFSRSIGGYDAAEVARALSKAQDVLESAEAAFRKADTEVRRLEGKLRERQTTKPKFAELGAAFESAITLAQDQAATLLSDAQKETKALVARAVADAESRSKAARLKSQEAFDKATAQAAKIRDQAEKDVARQRQAIKDDSARVAEERAQVDRVVAAVLADAESQIANLQARVTAEIEKGLAAANDELARATKLGARLDEETRVLEAKAAKNIDSILRAAEKYAAETTSEADEHTELSHSRADEVATETEKYVTQTQTRAAKTLDEARARSEHALINAEKITGEITAASQDFVANMTRDLEERLEKARRNLDDISGFIYTVKLLTNGFDLGDLNVARSQVSTDRANTKANIAELIED